MTVTYRQIRTEPGLPASFIRFINVINKQKTTQMRGFLLLGITKLDFCDVPQRSLKRQNQIAMQLLVMALLSLGLGCQYFRHL